MVRVVQAYTAHMRASVFRLNLLLMILTNYPAESMLVTTSTVICHFSPNEIIATYSHTHDHKIKRSNA